MPHDHHDHAHLDPESGDRRVAVAIWANGLLTIAQIVGGLLSGSLGWLPMRCTISRTWRRS